MDFIEPTRGGGRFVGHFFHVKWVVGKSGNNPVIEIDDR
jgi:hypothetical protein